ncbi:hypothetical protein L195_g061697 [Trifolium pratense]|uniref:Uncharacterized protein n=1 Tax=Trifolium pratense TaxID=57577 RepID=A0A2K3KBD6_TRIPR|nr:hypothetical protein L195_g061697 [Trifolium pratense]
MGYREGGCEMEGGKGYCGGEPGGNWFGGHVVKRVGDGSDTLFWTDP